MLFRKKINLISPLEKNEIINRLKKVTERQFSDTSGKLKFEGKISNDNFLIYPTFDYGSNNMIQPEIFGLITSYSDNTQLIKLEFRLPTLFKIFLLCMLLIYIGFITYIYHYPINKYITWKLFSIAAIGFGLVFLIIYHSKVQQSINTLSNLFKARNKI